MSNLDSAAIIITAVVTAVSSFATWIYIFAVLRVKVEKLWKDNEMWTEFHLRRSWAEAYQHNLAKKNSPISIIPGVGRKLIPEPLRCKLVEFYENYGKGLSDGELWKEIEHRFGEEILNEVCIKAGISQGACIIVAIAAAKRESERRNNLTHPC